MTMPQPHHPAGTQAAPAVGRSADHATFRTQSVGMVTFGAITLLCAAVVAVDSGVVL